jgi:flagellar capping protein FliD
MIMPKAAAAISTQYTALDRQMASLNSLSNYVTQQISTLNRSSNS